MNTNAFDGEAISRADREFLARLGDRPLLHNPLYSAPLPPLPDYAALTSAAAVEVAQKACSGGQLDHDPRNAWRRRSRAGFQRRMFHGAQEKTLPLPNLHNG